MDSAAPTCKGSQHQHRINDEKRSRTKPNLACVYVQEGFKRRTTSQCFSSGIYSGAGKMPQRFKSLDIYDA